MFSSDPIIIQRSQSFSQQLQQPDTLDTGSAVRKSVPNTDESTDERDTFRKLISEYVVEKMNTSDIKIQHTRDFESSRSGKDLMSGKANDLVDQFTYPELSNVSVLKHFTGDSYLSRNGCQARLARVDRESQEVSFIDPLAPGQREIFTKFDLLNLQPNIFPFGSSYLVFNEIAYPDNYLILDLSMGFYQKGASAFLGTPSELKHGVSEMFTKSLVELDTKTQGSFTFKWTGNIRAEDCQYINQQLSLKHQNQRWDNKGVTNRFFNARYGININPNN